MLNGRRQPSRGGTSRMNREVQVRFCERLGVQFPGPTRQNENSPILGLCQLLPPAPDIGLPMLPPPRAMNRLMQCSKIPSFDNIVGGGDKHRRNLSKAERVRLVPQ